MTALLVTLASAGPATSELDVLRAELAEARAEIARLQQELDDLTAPPPTT